MDTENTCTNIATDFVDTDQFICSNCGIHLQDWECHDGEDVHEYTFKYCPNCGFKIIDPDAMLNPCDCGGETNLIYTGLHYYVICKECGRVYIVNANKPSAAVKEWNENRWDKA